MWTDWILDQFYILLVLKSREYIRWTAGLFCLLYGLIHCVIPILLAGIAVIGNFLQKLGKIITLNILNASVQIYHLDDASLFPISKTKFRHPSFVGLLLSHYKTEPVMTLNNS